MAASEVVHDIAIRGRPEGLRELAQQANAVAKAQDAVVASTERLEKRSLSVQNSLNRLQRQYDSTFRAQESVARVERTLNRAREQGLVTEARHAQLLGLATDRINKQVGANDNLSKSSERAAHQMGQLAFQAQDVVASLGSGASPLTILLQQGGQVYSALDGPGGVSAGLRNVRHRITELVTPTRLMGASFVAAGAVAYAAWSRFDDLQRSILLTTQGLGRHLGLTAGEFGALSNRGSAAGGVSQVQGAGLATALARTGNVSAGNIEKILSQAKDLANTLGGGDIQAGIDKIVQAFGSGASGLEEMNRQITRFKGGQLEVFERLLRQNRLTEAASMILDNMNGKLAKFEETSSRITVAWERVKAAFEPWIMSIGGALDKATRFIETGSTQVPTVAPKSPAPSSGASVVIAETEAQVQAAEKAMTAVGKSDADRIIQERIDNMREMTKQFDVLTPAWDRHTKAIADHDTILETGSQEVKDRIAAIQGYSDAISASRQYVESLTNSEGKRMSQEDVAVGKGQARLRQINATTQAQRMAAEAETVEAENRGVLQTKRMAEIGMMQRLNEIRALDNKQLENSTRALKEQSEVMDLERRMIFATDAERNVAIATLKAEQEIRRLLGTETTAQSERLREQAKRTAEQVEANKKLKESVDFAAGTAGEFIKGFTSDLRRGTDAVEALTNAFGRLADKLSDRAIDLALDVLKPSIGKALLPTSTSAPVGLYHSGGIVGYGASQSRYVHPAYFENAPRYHAGGFGGLRPNEVPTIMERGEEVLTRGDPRHRWNGGGQGMNVTINNAPPGTSATQAPDGSLMINVASAVVAANNQGRDYRNRKARPL
jgi:hypothetical protein